MISIVGPGGVGGLLAALLIRSGQEVTVVARPATAERIGQEGLRVESAQFGTFSVNPTVALVPVGGAPAIITVKQYGLADVIPDLGVAQPVEVLSLLNGVVHAPLVHTVFNQSAAANGSINVVVERREDGVIHHPVDFCIVNVASGAADFTLVRALRDAGVEVVAEGTEHEVLWKKLRFLAPMALLTSWADAPIGEALAREPDFARGLVDEVAAIATAEGLRTSTDRLLDSLAAVPAGSMSSLSLDVRRGGPTELTALGDDLIYRAGNHSIATPNLECAVNAIGARLA
ncbi:MAG TPA: ketopantoate reductase family protein [Actinomycetales bacterium]|nr:ketopantoate reductase family protein [Actinomycetales bacterium]